MKKTLTKTLKARFRSEYAALRNAKDRCSRESHPQYADYGGRGIRVSPLFLDPILGFANFLGEIGAKPDPSLTLDRLINSKGYEPGNIAWRSRSAQVKNRRKKIRPDTDYGFGLGVRRTHGRDRRGNRSPILPEYQGQSLSLCEWADKLGIAGSILRQRFQRGWPIEKVLAPNLFAPNGRVKKQRVSRNPMMIELSQTLAAFEIAGIEPGQSR